MKTLLNHESSGLLEFEPVRAHCQFDLGPGKYRIGLLALSNDLATERDFLNLGANDDIAIFVARVPNDDLCSVETLKAMEPELTKAAATLIPGSRLDAAAYSCTSGTVVMGYDTVARCIHEVRPGLPVITPITAAVSALQEFEAQRIAVLTPYIDEVNTTIANFLIGAGFELSAFTSFRLSSNEDMARLTPQSIFDGALEADRDDADALFISCTAIRAVDVVEQIEQKLGKPVVTANQALFWHSLCAVGYEESIAGFGRLMRRLPHRFQESVAA